MLAMVVAVLVPALAAGSGILLAPDGGYTNIVVKFDNDVSQRHCATYIQRLTVSKSLKKLNLGLLLVESAY